jgi:hypothetical protein
LNYWTGGTQSCKGVWGWCTGEKFHAIQANNLSWAPSQPELLKGEENCLHMKITPSKRSILLTDKECKNKFVYACQVKSDIHALKSLW